MSCRFTTTNIILTTLICVPYALSSRIALADVRSVATVIATAVTLLGSLAGCSRSPSDSSKITHHSGDISADSREPWMWSVVSDESMQKVLSQPLLPADAPIVQRLNTWITAIDSRLRARYPERLHGIPTPSVAVIQGPVNAFVAAMAVCAKDRVLVRDLNQYRLAQRLQLTSEASEPQQLLIGTNTVAPVASACIEQRTMSDQEVDARLALFNRHLGTDSTCRLSRDQEVIFLKDQGGGPCADSRFSMLNPMASMFGALQPAFLTTPNRVTFLSGLLETFDEHAVLAVMSHELGHYYGAHLMGLDADFNRFYAAEAQGTRTNSKPAFGGADDSNPRIRDAWNFDRAYGALVLDQATVAGTSAELVVNSMMVDALDQRGLSHYDYPAAGQAFPLDLARLLLNALHEAPSLMSATDGASHEPVCKQLLGEYLAPQKPIQNFLFDGVHDAATTLAAASDLDALWQKSSACLDAPFSGPFAVISTDLASVERLAWEGAASGDASGLGVLHSSETIYTNVARIVAAWPAGRFGRKSDLVDPQTLNTSVATLVFTAPPLPADASNEDKTRYRDLQQFLHQALQGSMFDITYFDLEKKNNRQLKAAWDLEDRQQAFAQQFAALEASAHLARYTMEDAADELSMELLTLIGQPTSDYARFATDFLAYADNVNGKAAEASHQPAPEPQLGPCLALQAAGWQTLPKWGSLKDPHASGCWRLYTLDREMSAHHYVPDSDPVTPFAFNDAGWTQAVAAIAPALDHLRAPGAKASSTSALPCSVKPQGFPSLNSTPVCLSPFRLTVE